MAALSAPAVMRVWEAGLARTAFERGLIILAAAHPDATPEEFDRLSLGARDRRLFAVREATFGGTLQAHAACPECGERVEFSVATRGLVGDAEPIDVPRGRVNVGDLVISFRLLTSGDLAAVRESAPAEAARLLARRSVEAITRDGADVDPDLLADDAVTALGAAMSEMDPDADVTFRVDCPRCETSWELPFDIGSYLWTEIAAQAQRLIVEVHMLARAYGWSEQDVLKMSAARRGAYLNLVS